MKLDQVERLREELESFAGQMLASVRRKDQRRWGACYLRGLMVDGKRKSIQPMAARLPDGNEQALQQFVSASPWDPAPVRARLARRMASELKPEAVIFDDTGYLKSGSSSPCVARQYTGTAGKITNCQIGVSAHLATETASCPVNWRLFVPEQWDPGSPRAGADVAERRARCGIPDEVGHTEKWRLALAMLDELHGWGVRAPLTVADAGYGEIGEFRQGLEDRGLDYAVQVAASVTAYPETAARTTPPCSGRGPRPTPRYELAASSVKDLARAAGTRAARRITWREGSRWRAGAPARMSSRFVFLRVRPASQAHHRAHRGQDLPVRWLITEWPTGASEPSKYWISNLPSRTTRAELVRVAKLRWRVEHDHRELKDGLGLDHYEGRTWNGWHHHVTLVSVAHAFLTLQRLDPKALMPA
ncbi:IS701 family transposase [Kutzneria buriramensis]|uniref:IS701 family transposase n=2 Tax=Kutzneria buriramensis TaxID=1045776 RepID=UPI0037495D50